MKLIRITGHFTFALYRLGKAIQSRIGSTKEPEWGNSPREEALQYCYYLREDHAFYKRQLSLFTHTRSENDSQAAYDDWDADMRRNV